MPSIITVAISPSPSHSPPTPPPKDTPKQRKKHRHRKAHSTSKLETITVTANEQPLAEEVMASALERKKRKQLPASLTCRKDDVQDLLQVPNITPLGYPQLKPSKLAPLLLSTTSSPSYTSSISHSKSNPSGIETAPMGDLLTSFSETSLATFDSETLEYGLGKARHMPRDELDLEGLDLRALLRDLDHQEEEKELARAAPKSSMQWDSEDEDEHVVGVAVGDKRGLLKKLMKRPKRKSDESDESSRAITDASKIAAKWKQRTAHLRSKAFAEVPSGPLTAPLPSIQAFTLPDHMLESATSMSEEADIPGPEVTPWIYQEELARITGATEFMKLHPPPPVPETHAKPAERGLRSVKSDCSIRTTATGNRIAAEIGPAKRAIAPSTTKIKNSPTFHISKLIESVPASIMREFEEAILSTKARVRAMKQQIESAIDGQHLPIDKHEMRRKNGDKLIARASRLGYAPIIDWDKLTAEEVEAYGYVLERDSAEYSETSKIESMFRHVGEQAAKDAITKRSYLQKQRWLEERTKAARAEGCLSTAQEKNLRTASRHISDAILAINEGRGEEAALMMQHATAEQGNLLDTPEKQDIALSDNSDPGWVSAESERMRTYEALCTAAQDYSHVTTQEAAAGLGITLGMNIGTADTKNTPQRPRAVSYTQSELDDFMASAGSSARCSFRVGTHSAGPVSPTSPLADRPLKVERSPVAPIDRFGKPIFQPKRDGDFMRKIQAEAERAKAIRAMGSHPALRQRSQVDNMNGPATAPMMQLNDVSNFREQLRSDKHDSKDYEDEELDLLDDYGSDCKADSLNKRISAMTWDYDNEDETARLEEQLIQLQEHTNGSTWSPLAYQIGLSRLSKFIDLQYPGSPQQPEEHDDEKIEYVDNPDYDHAMTTLPAAATQQTADSTGLGIQEAVTPSKPARSHAHTAANYPDTSVCHRLRHLTTPSRSTKAGPVSRPTMSVDIDNIIAEWEKQPRQLVASHRTEILASKVPVRGAVSQVHLLRLSLGIPALKSWKPGSGPRHPHHDYEWDTEKVMCYGKHTGRSKVLGLSPDVREQLRNDEYVERSRQFVQGKRAARPLSPSPHSRDLTQVRISNYHKHLQNPAPEEKQKLRRCARCSRFCCLYASCLLTSTISGSSAVEQKVRVEAEEKVLSLRTAWPAGVETFETFVKCVGCGKEVCPRCARVCRDVLCGEITCRGCEGGECGCGRRD